MELFRQFLLLLRYAHHHRVRRLRRPTGTYQILNSNYLLRLRFRRQRRIRLTGRLDVRSNVRPNGRLYGLKMYF